MLPAVPSAVARLAWMSGGGHGPAELRLGAGRWDAAVALQVGDVGQDLLDAVRRQQLSRCSGIRPVRVELLDPEVVHPLHVLVGVEVVGLDEHAELLGGADLVLDGADVLHRLRRLVNPLDRVGL
jgi:hypothetical protein